MFRGKNEGEPAKAGAPTLQGSRWACGPQVVNAGAKDLSTLTCGVAMNAKGGGVSVCWVWWKRLSVSHPSFPLLS